MTRLLSWQRQLIAFSLKCTQNLTVKYHGTVCALIMGLVHQISRDTVSKALLKLINSLAKTFPESKALCHISNSGVPANIYLNGQFGMAMKPGGCPYNCVARMLLTSNLVQTIDKGDKIEVCMFYLVIFFWMLVWHNSKIFERFCGKGTSLGTWFMMWWTILGMESIEIYSIISIRTCFSFGCWEPGCKWG